jgi:hypothetical protein
MITSRLFELKTQQRLTTNQRRDYQNDNISSI